MSDFILRVHEEIARLEAQLASLRAYLATVPDVQPAPPKVLDPPKPSRRSRQRKSGPRPKLTEQQMTTIVQRYQEGDSTTMLGKAFGVSDGLIRRILIDREIPRRAPGEGIRLALARKRQAQAEDAPPTGNPDQNATRYCLRCEKKFKSDGPGNRLCDRCRTRADASGLDRYQVRLPRPGMP